MDTLPDQGNSLQGLSSSESVSEEADFLATSLKNKVTATLVNAGPAGVSAAAAIISSRNKKRPLSFETNPSIRKRHTTRLLRKLRHTLEEFAARVGQQAIVLVINPIESNHSFKVFGTKPLLDILRSLQPWILEELKTNLTKRAPPQVEDDPSLYPLPPLDIDGIPTPVEKMTQAQLRAFIPHMLKYSTLRGKPGWGRESTKPPWWPAELPWANVRMDVRSESEKQKVSWTHALRQVVLNCYKYHGREDLLPEYSEEVSESKPETHEVVVNQPTMNLHTVTNLDGTVSLVQIDPSSPTVTLPDGTTAKIQFLTFGGADQGSVPNDDDVKCNSDLEALYNQSGQLIITGDDGLIKEIITLSGIDSTLQNNCSNILQLNSDSDGTVYVTPLKINKVMANGGDLDNIESGNIDTNELLSVDDHRSEELFQMISMASGTSTVSDMNNIKLEDQ